MSKSRPVSRTIVAVTSVLPTAVIIAAGCNGTHPTARPIVPTLAITTVSPQNRFVGTAVCEGCHPSEFSLWSNSNHSRTETLYNSARPSTKFPSPGPVPGTLYRVTREIGGLYLEAKKYPALRRRIDMVIGSGAHGVSLIHFVAGRKLDRLHLTYFPATRKMFVHPGEEAEGLYPTPAEFSGAQARDCVGCHAISVPPAPATTLRPKNGFTGVGCESCHGQAGLHIEAAADSFPGGDIHIARLTKLPPRDLNSLCGRCHGKEFEPGTVTTDTTETRRFEANAIMQSRCFWQAGGIISCLNCHKPHSDVSHNQALYDRACLRCHGKADPRDSGAAQANSCTAHRTANCTGCHMKVGPVFSDSKVPTTMSEHYIRLPGDHDRPGPQRSGVQDATNM